MRSAQWSGPVDLTMARIAGGVDLTSTELHDHGSLTAVGASISGDLDLRGSVLSGRMDASSAMLQGDLHFDGTVLGHEDGTSLRARGMTARRLNFRPAGSSWTTALSRSWPTAGRRGPLAAATSRLISSPTSRWSVT